MTAKKNEKQKLTENENKERLHNTKYLLQQYRRVAYSVRLSEEDFGERLVLDYGTALSTFRENAEMLNVDLSGTKAEGYMRSVHRSKCMLEVIDRALQAVRADPDHGEVMYFVLYYTYFSPRKLPNREAILVKLDCEGYQMSMVTYHTYLQRAICAMDGILWGYTAIDSMKIVDQFFPEEPA